MTRATTGQRVSVKQERAPVVFRAVVVEELPDLAAQVVLI